MRIVEPPRLQFRCSSCGALNEGETEEFSYQHTMPPTWMAKCGWCDMIQRVAPSPLIAQYVGSRGPAAALAEVVNRLSLMRR
jgi:hypothetical protein